MSATREFLLERPHFLARAIFYSLMGLLILFLVMSWWATINITVSGKGVIATKQDAVDVFTPDKMLLTDVFVQKGQQVLRHDLLAILSDEQGQLELRAPLDGTIAFMQSWRSDMLVKNDLPIFVIVPLDNHMVAKVEVLSSEMKAVKIGQAAKLKVNAYPFRNYGVWNASVVYVSVTTRKNFAGEDVYDLIIEIDKNSAEQKNQRLLLGQSLVADIVVERVRVFDYVLNFVRGVNYYM
jgi:HlyD family secretion protein